MAFSERRQSGYLRTDTARAASLFPPVRRIAPARWFLRKYRRLPNCLRCQTNTFPWEDCCIFPYASGSYCLPKQTCTHCCDTRGGEGTPPPRLHLAKPCKNVTIMKLLFIGMINRAKRDTNRRLYFCASANRSARFLKAPRRFPLFRQGCKQARIDRYLIQKATSLCLYLITSSRASLC